jgi:arylsulfatase A-like enzyme
MDTFEMRGIRQESRWQPARITTRADFQKMQNSYDTAVAYVDRQVGMILQKLRDVGIYDETAIVITADHGEDLGEYGLIGHGFATQHTTRIPFVLKWPESVPGTHGRTDDALHYHFDLAATLLGLLGIDVPDAWDARCFADQFLAGEEEGREALVTSQLAQAIQRSLRFVHRSKHYTYSRTYFGFFHSIPCETLYNLTSDPFALNNVVDSEPEAAEGARTAYAEWLDRLPDTNAGYPDPLDSVLADRRKWAARRAPSYASRLIETGREEWADRLPGVRDSHAD